MAGIFGIVSRENCVGDLFYGAFYLQHRAQNYCGIALNSNGKLRNITHHGLIRQQFPQKFLRTLKGNSGLSCISSDRQPVSELSGAGGYITSFDGNFINYSNIKDGFLKNGGGFSGYTSPGEVSDSVLLSRIISKEINFEKGIERLIESIEGDFSLVSLTRDGIYAARGWGRKPLILGQKDRTYAVSSESTSFVNIGVEIVRDVDPGEIVFLDCQGIHSIKKFNLEPIKYGTFEWVYTAYPASVIDGKTVAEVRKRIGKTLARRYPLEADIISPVPNSGRWHAVGYSEESGIPYEEVFVRFDYSDRSYTPQEQSARDEEARTKLIPIREVIEGKKIILVDDSIVRGTQTLNQVNRLKNEFHVREVHARIACPPLMAACRYGKTTKKDADCIARRMSVDQIQKKLLLDSLGYATVEDLEEAIGYSREKLCLECWGF